MVMIRSAMNQTAPINCLPPNGNLLSYLLHPSGLRSCFGNLARLTTFSYISCDPRCHQSTSHLNLPTLRSKPGNLTLNSHGRGQRSGTQPVKQLPLQSPLFLGFIYKWRQMPQDRGNSLLCSSSLFLSLSLPAPNKSPFLTSLLFQSCRQIFTSFHQVFRHPQI